MPNTSNPIFNPSCPDGGQYYACGNGAKFVGCCASDPCNDAGCSFGNLRTMSFDPTYYGPTYMPDQQCAATGAQWWSCNGTNPPFVGCCQINPCTSGCPQTNLIQGVLSNIASSANKYDPQPPLPSSSSTTSSSAPTASSDNSLTTDSSRISTGAVIGIAIGASVLILFIVLFMWWWRRRSHYRRREQSALNSVLTPITAFRNEKNSNYQDIPSEPSCSEHGTSLPIYGFQSKPHLKSHHQQIIHEADPANQIQRSLGFPSPSTAYTFSPGISAIGSPSYYPQPPSELAGDSDSLSPQQQHAKGLGLQRMSTMVELGDSERGTDDSKEREQRW